MQALIIKDGMLSSAETAVYLGISAGTLRNWRFVGTSQPQPPHHKIGSRCYYKVKDLDKWIEGTKV